MTAPRCILPDEYRFSSRRCTQRQYLLKPDELTNSVFAYCLAEAAARFNIGVIAVMVMSNHYHGVFHDRDGRLPEFFAHFHKMVAKVLNIRWQRSENFWASEQTCSIRCDGPEELIRATAYTLANPVKAQLVDSVESWPGLNGYARKLTSEPIRVARPECFFAKDGRMPEEAVLVFQTPELFSDIGPERWAERVEDAVHAAEEAARRVRQQNGSRVLGRKAVLRQGHTDAPSTSRGVKQPSRWHRHEARQRCKVFLRQYYDAWRKLQDGMRDAIFPVGTYLLRIRQLVSCDALPAH